MRFWWVYWLYSIALSLPLYPSERRKYLSQPSAQATVYTVGLLQHHREDFIYCKVKGQQWKLSPSAHQLKKIPKCFFSPHLFWFNVAHPIMLWLETDYVQFCVLIFHHAQGSASEQYVGWRGIWGGCTNFVQCTPDVIFNFKSPVEHFT